MSATGGGAAPGTGASVTPGSGEGVATKYAFGGAGGTKSKRKKGILLYKKKIRECLENLNDSQNLYNSFVSSAIKSISKNK